MGPLITVKKFLQEVMAQVTGVQCLVSQCRRRSCVHAFQDEVLPEPQHVHLCVQSLEGASLVDVQTTALFGNLRDLQEQMQKAVGQDATSIEELMQKVQVLFFLASMPKH